MTLCFFTLIPHAERWLAMLWRVLMASAILSKAWVTQREPGVYTQIQPQAQFQVICSWQTNSVDGSSVNLLDRAIH